MPVPDRRLTLLRHAKSGHDDPTLADFQRTLSARGERDAPLMAERMARAGLVPDLIISSPAARALATARVFADILACPREHLRLDERAYLATEDELLRILQQQDATAGHVMLVGHNPGLAALACALVGEDTAIAMPTCAIASLLVPVGDWHELGPASATLDWYQTPRQG